MGSFTMMELTACAFVVTVLSSVSATPYGYGGVKSGAGTGASAAAVSSGVAGTFGERGDIPQGNAFGPGFSGSFTKSSSSSSSSSSASSSSSSSSFTYSGLRPGDFVNPASNGNIGCKSGLCQNSGNNEIYGNQGPSGAGSGYQGYNAPNSVPGYGTAPGTDCQGSLCNDNSRKCSLGQCQTKPQDSSSPTGQDSAGKCTTGECGSQIDDSDDIRFVAHSSKSLDSNDQSFNDKTSESIVKSNCQSGNCGLPIAKAHPTYAHGAIDSYGDPIPSSNLLPTDSNTKPASGYFPSRELETPKLDSNCNSGSCNVDYTNPRYENPPTSYSEPKPSCVKGKCDNPLKGNYATTTSNSLSTNYISPQGSYSTTRPSYANPGSSCTGPSCGGSTSRPYEGTNIKLPNCNSPNCNPYYDSGSPTAPTAVQPEQNTYSGPNEQLKPSSGNLPVYTGGFGGPGGVLKPNEYDTPVTGSYHSTQPSTTFNNKPIQSAAPTVASPHYGTSLPTISTAHPDQNTYPGSSDKLKPHTGKPPVYTGGFGGPGGVLNPNEYDTPVTGSYHPTQSSTTLNNNPIQSTVPTVASPHYGTSLPTVPTAHPELNTYPGSNDKIKPPTGKPPIYTSGFGGPSGVLKPNQYDTPVTGSFHPTQSSTTLNNNPIQSTVPTVASPHYGTSLPSVPTAHPELNTYPGSNDKIKPLTGKPPIYTSGFGGPSGVLKPNQYDTPVTGSYHPTQSSTTLNNNPIQSTVPTVASPHYGTSLPTVPTAHPELNTYPGSNDKIKPPTGKPPIYTSGFGGPSGVLKPNQYDTPVTGSYHPTQPSTTFNNNPIQVTVPTGCNTPGCSSPVGSTHYDPSLPTSPTAHPGQNTYSEPNNKLESSKPPVYAGGFGGPVGVLKPNEFNTPATGSYHPTQPSTTLNNRPSQVTAPAGCNTPGCYNPVSTPAVPSQSHYGINKPSTSEVKGPVYTGGFGGPPGILKPNEFDISVPSTTKPMFISNPTYSKPSPTVPGCTTSNCASSSTIGSTSTTSHTGSYGTHIGSGTTTTPDNNLPVYTGGFGGPPGMFKPDEFDIKVPIHSQDDIKIPIHSSNPSHLHPPTSPIIGCNTPNCNNNSPLGQLPHYNDGFGNPYGNPKPNDNSGSPTSLSGTIPQSTLGPSKSIASPPSSSISFPGQRSNYRPVGVNYHSAPAVAPIIPSYANTQPQYPIAVSFDKCKTGDCPSDSYDHHAGCKTGHCVNNPTGGPVSHEVKNPATDGKPFNPQYTGAFNKPSESVPSSGSTSNIPSIGTDVTDCKHSNCAGGSVSGADSQSTSYTYTGSFGAPSDLLKPNDSAKPDSSSVLSKPATGTAAPVPCSTGKCHTSGLTAPSIVYDTGLSGSHAIASSSASANAGIYSGGFGGPPGFLTPHDNGKVDLTKIIGGHNQGLHYGGANTPNVGATGPASFESNNGHLGISAAGSTAAAGSIASAYSGSHGYNAQDHPQAGTGIPSPCKGRCGIGYQGTGSYAAAGAKSLSSSQGSYAGSSASAYSSAGAYTKGGYGKR